VSVSQRVSSTFLVDAVGGFCGAIAFLEVGQSPGCNTDTDTDMNRDINRDRHEQRHT
jgi:hypothetical protein